MNYDYALLSSFLFASLLILIIGYTRYLMQRFADQNEKSGKAEIQYNSKRVDINSRLIIFMVLMIILSRIAFIVMLPSELQQHHRVNFIFSMRTFFLVWQSILVFSYIYYLFRIFLGKRLQDAFRYAYLSKTLFVFAILTIIDLISSFSFYNIITYNLIFSVENIQSISDKPLLLSKESISIAAILIGLIGFILFFIRLQKKRTPFNFLGYVILHILTICFVLYFIFDHIEYFFTNQSLLYSALDIFSLSGGFVGWIWLFILFLGLSSQAFGLTIIRLKDKFINKQIAINYIVQLSKLSFVSVICFCFIAILPIIFLGFIEILN
ncbi:MAG: hypothetical protein JW956_02280 [Calditrichaceae bacterium]|nr:hypothetical protein [Calditrichaceae bacterium]